MARPLPPEPHRYLVDVGAGAMILGKVKVGDNSRIGANAVITMNVPANSLAVAQPARVIPMPAGQAAQQPPSSATHAAGKERAQDGR